MLILVQIWRSDGRHNRVIIDVETSEMDVFGTARMEDERYVHGRRVMVSMTRPR